MSAVDPIKDVEYEHPLPGNACDTRHAWARVPADPRRRSAALKDQIKRLLKERNAVMVSHYYVHPDLQDLAEETGGIVSDSLEMARFGRDHAAQTLVVSGVKFMGETAKIVSPEKRVLMPDLDATCSLDLGCPADEFDAFCNQHPDRTVVVYANTSAAVKARSDWLVTSSCALDIVGALKAKGHKILWAPVAPGQLHPARDRRRHGVLERRVHRARRVQGLRAGGPEEAVPERGAGAPRVPADVVALADAVGSTSAILKPRARWTPGSSSSPPTTA